MKCRICQKLKNIRGIDVLLAIIICLCMYIANQYTLNTESKNTTKDRDQLEVEYFEALQKECYLKNIQSSCKKLKAFE